MDEPALQVAQLRAGYGSMSVLRGVSLSVHPGQVLLVLGRNGSGRSTLLKALVGLIPSEGSIRLLGQPCEQWPTHRRVRQGLGYVPETRDVFPGLTVEQNLNLGRWQGGLRVGSSFPRTQGLEASDILQQRLQVPAGQLSGGEQQLLSLARTLAAQPRVVLADEPTEGLAPTRVGQVAEQVQATARSGTAWVLVEQKLQWALPLAHRVVVLGRGEVVFEGSPDQLQSSSTLWRQWIWG